MAAPITPLQLRPQDAPGLTGGLLPLNTFLRQVQQALERALTFKENQAARIIEAKVPTVAPWLYPTFLNSWTDFNAPSLRVRFTKLASGQVILSGAMKSGVIGSAAFILPAGYHPDQDTNFAVDPSVTASTAKVGSDGTYQPKMGSNSFFAVDCTFPAADQNLASNILNGPLVIPHGLQRVTDLWITSCHDTRTNALIMNPGAPVWYDDGKGNVVLQALPSLYGPGTFAIRFLCLSEPT